MATVPTVTSSGQPTISVLPQGPLAGAGSTLPRPPGVIGAGAQFSGWPRPPWATGGGSLVGQVFGGGPNIVPTTVDPTTTGSTGELPGGTGLPTLDALMARQKELALQKAPDQGPMLSPWQGVASAFDKALTGFQQGRTQRDILAQEAARAQIMGSLDPGTGLATPEQIQAMMEVDPELATHLYDAALQARLAEGKQDTWEQIPTPEGENGQWFRNPRTGETKKVGGGSPGESGWKPSDIGSLRDDYTKAATVYESASPSWEDMKRASQIALDPSNPNKGAATYAIVVGYAKLLDPTSVVREGEVKAATDLGGLIDTVNGWLQKAKDGSMSPDVLQAIMRQANSRMKAYYDQAAAKRNWIVDIAKRNRLNPDDVVPPLAEFSPWAGVEDDTEPAVVTD